MNTKIQIKTHMEYLGYEVTPGENDDVLFCEKPGFTDLMVSWNDKRINIYAHYKINSIAKCNSDKVLRYINDLNSKSNTVTFWVEDELFRMSADYTGEYDRSVFATFFTAMEYDTNNLLDLVNETKLYLGDIDQTESYIQDTKIGAIA